MTEDNRRTAIGHELAHGESAMEAARALLALGLYNDALNRLCYALFHHASALLLTSGIEPRRHAAIPGLLGQYLIPKGWVDAADVGCFGRTCAYRDLADYERTWKATREITESAFAEVEPLIKKILDRLDVEGWRGIAQ